MNGNVPGTQASPLLVAGAFATVYIVWGSTYFFIQQALAGFPPFLLGAVRFLVAGAIFLIFCFVRGYRIFIRQQMKQAALGGILMLFIGNGVVIWVEQTIPSAMVAIMISSSPLWFVLLDKRNWSANFSNKVVIAGILVGFAGVLILFGQPVLRAFSASGSATQIGSLFLLIGGVISWAAGSLYVKYNPSGGNAMVSTAWQMFFAGLAFVPGLLLRGELQSFSAASVPAAAWLSLLYLIFMGSLLGYSAYVWLLQVRSATQVSTYAYVNPVVAVLLGIFLGNEKVSSLQITGLCVILGSVLLINLNRRV